MPSDRIILTSVYHASYFIFQTKPSFEATNMSNHHHLPLFAITLLLLILSSTLLLAAELCNPADKKALLNIKKAFKNASIFYDWIDNTDCCQWTSPFVRCDHLTHRVTSIIAIGGYDGVAVPIPNAVGDLPFLEDLQFFSFFNLYGPIPQPISKLKNLKTLELGSNNLTGPIPNFLANLHELTSIELSNNKFTGSIPGFLAHLRKLTFINLSNNKLSGSLPPSLSLLHNLNGLLLGGNRLTGSIPKSFGEFRMNPYMSFSLENNKLFGSLPKSLGFVNFTELSLSGNLFEGDGSMFFGKNKILRSFNISGNMFSFDITNVEFPMSLSNLDLSYNRIYGILPVALVKLQDLSQFNVSYNRLCGEIPSGGEFKQFDKYVYAHNLCLCGSPLPPCK